jgi:hypothetical protein
MGAWWSDPDQAIPRVFSYFELIQLGTVSSMNEFEFFHCKQQGLHAFWLKGRKTVGYAQRLIVFFSLHLKTIQTPHFTRVAQQSFHI